MLEIRKCMAPLTSHSQDQQDGPIMRDAACTRAQETVQAIQAFRPACHSVGGTMAALSRR